jgi:hypothetical protein
MVRIACLVCYHELLSSQTGFVSLQAAYGSEMVRRHGEDVDWRHAPIDPTAVHASGGGKQHGR